MSLADMIRDLAADDGESEHAPPQPALVFEHFADENRRRCEAVDGFNHRLESWSLSDWFTATMGELGEAANIAKKLNRFRDCIIGNSESEEELRSELADELADTFIYLDLLCQSAQISLSAAVISKFNRTSDRIGYPHHLAVATA